jgi:hypothetical protein
MNLPQPTSQGWTQTYLRQLRDIVDAIIRHPRHPSRTLRQLTESEREVIWNATAQERALFKEAEAAALPHPGTPENWVRYLKAGRWYDWVVLAQAELVIARRLTD